MGKYDQFLAGLPPAEGTSSGKYDAFTKDLPSQDSGQFNGLKEALSKIPRIAQNIPGLEPLAAISELKGPADAIHAQFPEQAGNLAEYMGGKGYSDTASALTTLPIAMAPEIVSAGLGIGGMMMGNGTIPQALRNTPKTLGKQYAAQDAAAGITRETPQVASKAVFESPYENTLTTKPMRGIPAKTTYESNLVGAEALPSNIPKKLPDNFPGFKNFADARIKTFGEKLSPQELMNYKVHLQTQMSNPTEIPKFDSQTGKITQIYRDASDLQTKIASTFKKVMDSKLKVSDLPKGTIPTRTQLDKVNTLSNTIRGVPKKAGKVALYVGGAGGALATGKRLWDALGK